LTGTVTITNNYNQFIQRAVGAKQNIRLTAKPPGNHFFTKFGKFRVQYFHDFARSIEKLHIFTIWPDKLFV